MSSTKLRNIKPGQMVRAKDLKDADACSAQVRLFTRHFPGGASFVRSNLIAAASAGLEVAWLIEAIASGPDLVEFYQFSRALVRDAHCAFPETTSTHNAPRRLLFYDLMDAEWLWRYVCIRSGVKP